MMGARQRLAAECSALQPSSSAAVASCGEAASRRRASSTLPCHQATFSCCSTGWAILQAGGGGGSGCGWFSGRQAAANERRAAPQPSHRQAACPPPLSRPRTCTVTPRAPPACQEHPAGGGGAGWGLGACQGLPELPGPAGGCQGAGQECRGRPGSRLSRVGPHNAGPLNRRLPGPPRTPAAPGVTAIAGCGCQAWLGAPLGASPPASGPCRPPCCSPWPATAPGESGRVDGGQQGRCSGVWGLPLSARRPPLAARCSLTQQPPPAALTRLPAGWRSPLLSG